MSKKSKLEIEATEHATASHKYIPDFPSHLTEVEAEVWNYIFEKTNSGFVAPESYDLLAAYCQKVVRLRLYSAKLSAVEATIDFSDANQVKNLEKLSKMVDLEQRGLLALARSLRLTTQSLISYKTKRTDADANDAEPLPWDEQEETHEQEQE